MVDKRASVDDTVKIGDGSVIMNGVVLDKGVEIGMNVFINIGAAVAHDSVISSHSFIAPRVAIAGFSRIGECNFLGINSTVIDNITTADHVTVGAGAVVINNLPTDGLYVGVPAKKNKMIMQTINVLVLGVGGNVSQGIMTALRLSRIPVKIIGACVSEESLGLYFCDKAYISPYADSPDFISWYADLCIKEKIDITFSGVEEIIEVLERNREALKGMKTVFVSSSRECLNIGNDKYLTCRWLKDNALNYPLFASSDNSAEIVNLLEKTKYPLIAKPKRGKGSAGIIRINSEKDLSLVPRDNYVIQECLGDADNEYTVGCYVNKQGDLDAMIVFRRYLKYGTTFKAEIVQDSGITAECARICSAFHPAGPLNIQMRKHEGKAVCFELNVRFSGTTAMRARWGFNDVAAMLNEYILGQPTNLHPYESGIAYRYFNEAYIDQSMMAELSKTGHISDVSSYSNFKEL